MNKSIKIKIALSLITLFSCSSYTAEPFTTVLTSPELIQQLLSFNDTVLRQVPSAKLAPLLKRIGQHEQPATDDSWYQLLNNELHTVLPNRFGRMYTKLQALTTQKTTIGAQIKQLLQARGIREIRGAVEIGNPGTYLSTLSGAIQLTGPTYALIEAQTPTDHIAGFALKPLQRFLAYQKFIPLNE